MQNSSMILVPVNGPNVAPFGFSAYPVPPHCFGQRPESKRTGLVLTPLAQQIMQEPGTRPPYGLPTPRPPELRHEIAEKSNDRPGHRRTPLRLQRSLRPPRHHPRHLRNRPRPRPRSPPRVLPPESRAIHTGHDPENHLPDTRPRPTPARSPQGPTGRPFLVPVLPCGLLRRPPLHVIKAYQESQPAPNRPKGKPKNKGYTPPSQKGFAPQKLIKRRLPGVVIELVDRSRGKGAGVVDQAVHSPERMESGLHGTSHALRLGKVRPHPHHLGPEALGQLLRPLPQLLAPPRATMTTRAPSAASAWAMARPIPFDPPVTMQRLARRSSSIRGNVVMPAPSGQTSPGSSPTQRCPLRSISSNHPVASLRMA